MACGPMQQPAILVWVILLQLCIVSFATKAGTHEDADILLQFKSAVCKGCWTGLEDWNSQNISNMCTWHGVTCDPEHPGRVTALQLIEHGLSGALPASLGNLTYLTYLSLYLNPELTGNIPSEIGHLRLLKYLDLGWCNFTGALPSSIWNLTSLINLYLAANSLDIIIPDEISNLQQLQALYIPGRYDRRTFSTLRSQIRGSISKRLSNCTNLKLINLGWNMLTETIPVEWQSLYNLEILRLSHNSINSSLAYMLSVLSNCTKLDYLDLGHNVLSGTFPVDWQRLPNLALLRLPYNDLTGSLPPMLPGWSNLVMLSLSGNRLSGNLPAYLGTLPKLKFLILGSNSFHGRIPSSFSRNFQQVSNNQLSESPQNKGKNIFIYFDVSSNNLTGPLPYGLSAEYYFNVSFNYFEGEVSLSIFSSSADCIIDLSYNQFDRINPLQIHTSSMASYVDVSNNRLTRDIQYFCLLPGLALLDASSNGMTGELPMCLFNMTKLQVLVIFNNSFSSPFPNITNLQGFRHNALDYFLVSADYFDQRSLSYQIPGTNETIQFSIPMLFRIRTKGVKRAYQSYTNAYVNLTLLDISLNNFSGPIPSALASLNLRYLNLSFNKFDGLIPAGIAKIPFLESLDLSNNRLTGSVSPLFCNPTGPGLSIFNLSQNQLEGEVPIFCCTKYDKTSFLHNPDLCGCPPLRPCRAPSPDQHLVPAAPSGESFLDNVSIPASIIGFFIGLFPALYICCKTKRRL